MAREADKGASRCFCCFCSKSSAIDVSFPAEILGRRLLGDQKNSKAPAVRPLFSVVLGPTCNGRDAVAENSLLSIAHEDDVCQFSKCLYSTTAGRTEKRSAFRRLPFTAAPRMSLVVQHGRREEGGGSGPRPHR